MEPAHETTGSPFRRSQRTPSPAEILDEEERKDVEKRVAKFHRDQKHFIVIVFQSDTVAAVLDFNQHLRVHRSFKLSNGPFRRGMIGFEQGDLLRAPCIPNGHKLAQDFEADVVLVTKNRAEAYHKRDELNRDLQTRNAKQNRKSISYPSNELSESILRDADSELIARLTAEQISTSTPSTRPVPDFRMPSVKRSATTGSGEKPSLLVRIKRPRQNSLHSLESESSGPSSSHRAEAVKVVGENTEIVASLGAVPDDQPIESTPIGDGSYRHEENETRPILDDGDTSAKIAHADTANEIQEDNIDGERDQDGIRKKKKKRSSRGRERDEELAVPNTEINMDHESDPVGMDVDASPEKRKKKRRRHQEKSIDESQTESAEPGGIEQPETPLHESPVDNQGSVPRKKKRKNKDRDREESTAGIQDNRSPDIQPATGDSESRQEKKKKKRDNEDRPIVAAPSAGMSTYVAEGDPNIHEHGVHSGENALIGQESLGGNGTDRVLDKYKRNFDASGDLTPAGPSHSRHSRPKKRLNLPKNRQLCRGALFRTNLYWQVNSKSTKDLQKQVELVPGRKVYIYEHILDDLDNNFGPKRCGYNQRAMYNYAGELLMHMADGPDAVRNLKLKYNDIGAKTLLSNSDAVPAVTRYLTIKFKLPVPPQHSWIEVKLTNKANNELYRYLDNMDKGNGAPEDEADQQ